MHLTKELQLLGLLSTDHLHRLVYQTTYRGLSLHPIRFSDFLDFGPLTPKCKYLALPYVPVPPLLQMTDGQGYVRFTSCVYTDTIWSGYELAEYELIGYD